MVFVKGTMMVPVARLRREYSGSQVHWVLFSWVISKGTLSVQSDFMRSLPIPDTVLCTQYLSVLHI